MKLKFSVSPAFRYLPMAVFLAFFCLLIPLFLPNPLKINMVLLMDIPTGTSKEGSVFLKGYCLTS